MLGIKTDKLQTDIIKAAQAREEKRKYFPFRWGKSGEDFLVVNESWLVVIPKCVFFLNPEIAFDTPATDLQKIVKLESDVIPATDTGIEKQLSDGKKVHVFQVGDEEVWVNVNSLKYMDLSELTFMGRTKKTPLYMMKYDNVVGVVIGVNHS